MSEFKVGDKAWVLCEVTEFDRKAGQVRVSGPYGGNFWTMASDCRPVEPKSVEQDLPKFNPGDCIRVASPSHEWDRKIGEILCFDTQGDGFTSYMVKLHDLDYAVPIPSHLMKLNNPRPTKEPTQGQKIAERTMKAIWAANDWGSETPVVKESLTTEPNSPRILDSSSDPLLLGDAVELQSNNVWRGTKGILTNWCPIKKAFWFESLDPSRKAINGWMKEQWDDEETGICRLVKIDHPNDSPKPDSSSDPVNPSHYKQGGIECIEAIKAATGDGFPDYLRGNVMKYLWRYKEKGGVDDLRKSAWYLDRLIKEASE